MRLRCVPIVIAKCILDSESERDAHHPRREQAVGFGLVHPARYDTQFGRANVAKSILAGSTSALETEGTSVLQVAPTVEALVPPYDNDSQPATSARRSSSFGVTRPSEFAR